MKKVTIYTDGACSGNPGDGGWGAVLRYGGHEKEISGFEENTTNNRMELTAAVEALKVLKEPCEVELYSDSAYMVNAFNAGWLQGWKMNGWMTAGKDEVKNIELWKQLDQLARMHRITWIKVKGHADNEYNNRCDKLATGEIKKHRKGDGS
jgi:ribonuclease HI